MDLHVNDFSVSLLQVLEKLQGHLERLEQELLASKEKHLTLKEQVHRREPRAVNDLDPERWVRLHLCEAEVSEVSSFRGNSAGAAGLVLGELLVLGQQKQCHRWIGVIPCSKQYEIPALCMVLWGEPTQMECPKWTVVPGSRHWATALHSVGCHGVLRLRRAQENPRNAHLLSPEDPLLPRSPLPCSLLYLIPAFISPAWFLSVPHFRYPQTIPKG